MATCDDLVNAINSLGSLIASLSINIDAVRQSIECMREDNRQYFPDREFIAFATGQTQNVLLQGFSAVSQQLNHLSTIQSGTETPASQIEDVYIVDEFDMRTIDPCSITTYCPPGQIKNEQGQCVSNQEIP